MRPIWIVVVELLHRICWSWCYFGICDHRRVARHFDDACRIASDFSRVERSNPNGDFDWRHFRIEWRFRSLVVIYSIWKSKGKFKLMINLGQSSCKQIQWQQNARKRGKLMVEFHSFTFTFVLAEKIIDEEKSKMDKLCPQSDDNVYRCIDYWGSFSIQFS